MLSLDGEYGEVDNILIEDRTQTMYNLTVDVVHTFAVGDGEWIVHNKNEVCTIRFAESGRDPNTKDEHGLIQVGHVGISVDDGATIYGFHPHKDAIAALELEGIKVLDFLKYGSNKVDRVMGSFSGGALRGQLQNDTAIFKRAYELSQQGVRTVVTM